MNSETIALSMTSELKYLSKFPIIVTYSYINGLRKALYSSHIRTSFVKILMASVDTLYKL